MTRRVKAMLAVGVVLLTAAAALFTLAVTGADGQSDHYNVKPTAASSCGPVHATCSEQAAPTLYKITKQCRQYIRQHLKDKFGVPVNACTVDFVGATTPSVGGYELSPGYPLPVGMTCNMAGCFLNMKGVLQEYGTKK